MKKRQPDFSFTCKVIRRLWLITVFVIFIPGCYDRLDLEEATSPFMIGYDLDEDNNMLVYVTSPMFSRDVKRKTHEITVVAKTTREAREKEDARSAGSYHGRKIQILLIGKRLMQHEEWFRMVDVFFRDPKNSVTQRVVAYDGPLSEIVYLNPKDQPMLPVLLRGMVDTKSARSETVKTTLRELHRQMFEKGITPYVTEIKLANGEVALLGTTLLDHKGKYAATLDNQETVLLRMLQKAAKKPVSLTIPIPGETKRGPFDTDRLSFNTEKVKTKINTAFSQGRFQFDIKINMRIVLTELLFPYDMRKQKEELENMIVGQLQKRFDDLMLKIQKRRIDPIGLGLYARADEYKQFKKVEEHWGEELSEADIRIAVKVEIGAMGPVK